MFLKLSANVESFSALIATEPKFETLMSSQVVVVLHVVSKYSLAALAGPSEVACVANHVPVQVVPLREVFSTFRARQIRCTRRRRRVFPLKSLK